MVCGLCHREPDEHTDSTSGPTRCEYLTHREDCPGNFRTSCDEHKSKTKVEETVVRDDAAMDTLEQGLKSLQLTPDSGQGLMVQLQQLLVQHQAPLQPVLEHDQQVLQQLGTLLQKTPLAENKIK